MNTTAKLKKYLDEIKKNDKSGKKINAILQLNPAAMDGAKIIDGKIAKSKAGKLAGQVIAVKANINVKGLNASCASKVLENYVSPYDATVIKKIREEDGLIIGMANMDEFACGWSGETSAFGPTRNPQALDLVAGGTSSGSAASVAAGFCDIALGSDTGGSIRVPSSHCGVVGVKPTYGSVSRYGLIDMCMSFDQIGPVAKNVSDAALLLSVIYGKDECDAISQNLPTCPECTDARRAGKEINLSNIQKIPKNITIGLLDFPISDVRIQKLINDKIEEASKKYGWEIKKVKIPYLELAIATYFPIVYVEFFSATRRFDGRRYGKKIEDAAGPEVLRRILGGSEISKAEHHGRYYHKALRVRKLLGDEFGKTFSKVDCIISPTVPRLPHKIGSKISSEEMFQYDALTCPMNIVGNCALSLPVGKIDGIPVGMQITCDKFEDELMLRIARAIEKV
ncbi:MAG: aspartyl/glutamyl-tRNA amidotransferase subunit A [Nanoarchaeota archaeon]|nr:aspartyl/glutamyl-tRNA amidotransferase subunit A [Nanoarchaeota archaeon]